MLGKKSIEKLEISLSPELIRVESIENLGMPPLPYTATVEQKDVSQLLHLTQSYKQSIEMIEEK